VHPPFVGIGIEKQIETRDTMIRMILLAYVVGAFLILMGILVPSQSMIELLRSWPDDPKLQHQLLAGAALFRGGLIFLGLIGVLLIRIPILRQTKPKEGPRNGDGGRYTFLLLTILVISFFVRMYKIDQGLWLDEIAMCVKYLRLTIGEVLTTYNSENQHHLFTLMAHICRSLLGETALALRLPAVFFGVGSLAALYLLAIEVTNKKESILATALLAFSYYHVWFSQNARGYTGLLFWTLLTSRFLLRALRTGTPREWLWYAVTVAPGIFTQFTLIFVVMGHFLIYLKTCFDLRKTQTRLLLTGPGIGFGLAGVLTFQLFALTLPQFFSIIGMKGTVEAWNSPLWTLLEFVRGMRMNFSGTSVPIVVLLLFITGLWSYLRTSPVLISLLILPPVIGSTVVLLMKHPLWPRFFFFTFGFGALVVIRGAYIWGRTASTFLKVNPARSEHIGLAGCIGMILVSALTIPRAYLPKQDFVGVKNFIEQHSTSGDSVVTIGRAAYPYEYFYKTGWPEIKTIEALDEIRSRSKRTWLIYMIPEDVRVVYPELWNSIERDFKTITKFPSPLADGTIYVSRADSS